VGVVVDVAVGSETVAALLAANRVKKLANWTSAASINHINEQARTRRHSYFADWHQTVINDFYSPLN
jgi:hypothetical protein